MREKRKPFEVFFTIFNGIDKKKVTEPPNLISLPDFVMGSRAIAVKMQEIANNTMENPDE